MEHQGCRQLVSHACFFGHRNVAVSLTGRNQENIKIEIRYKTLKEKRVRGCDVQKEHRTRSLPICYYHRHARAGHFRLLVQRILTEQPLYARDSASIGDTKGSDRHIPILRVLALWEAVLYVILMIMNPLEDIEIHSERARHNPWPQATYSLEEERQITDGGGLGWP